MSQIESIKKVALCKQQNGKFKEQSPGGVNTVESGQKGMKMWQIPSPPKKPLS